MINQSTLIIFSIQNVDHRLYVNTEYPSRLCTGHNQSLCLTSKKHHGLYVNTLKALHCSALVTTTFAEYQRKTDDGHSESFDIAAVLTKQLHCGILLY